MDQQIVTFIKYFAFLTLMQPIDLEFHTK